MQRIQRFARYWNLTVNNGQFIKAAPLIWQHADSPFAAFMQWSNWLYEKTNTTGNLHMVRLAKLLMEFLTADQGLDEKTVAYALWTDYQRGNRPDIPGFLKKIGFEKEHTEQTGKTSPMPRQARHLKD